MFEPAMGKVRRAALLAVFSITGPIYLSSQSFEIKVHTLAALDQEAPVRVVGLEAPHSDNRQNRYILHVTLKNVSQKTVNAVRLQSVTVAPRGCGANFSETGFVLGDNGSKPVTIAPNGVARSSTGVSAINVVVPDSLWLQSRYVQVQVGVAGVDFDDGTSWELWKDVPLGAGRVFSLELLEKDAHECGQWPWPEGLDVTNWSNSSTLTLTPLRHVSYYRENTGLTIGDFDSEEALASYAYTCRIDLAHDSATCATPIPVTK